MITYVKSKYFKMLIVSSIQWVCGYSLYNYFQLFMLEKGNTVLEKCVIVTLRSHTTVYGIADKWMEMNGNQFYYFEYLLIQLGSSSWVHRSKCMYVFISIAKRAVMVRSRYCMCMSMGSVSQMALPPAPVTVYFVGFSSICSFIWRFF